MNWKHPFGILILAPVLLLIALPLAFTGIVSFVATISLIRRTPGLGGGAMLLATSLCPVILGGVCAAAGLDLLRLRRRGRPVTIFLSCIFGVFAGDMLLLALTERTDRSSDPHRLWLWGSGAVFLFCIWAVVYLCLPGVRRKLELKAKC